MVNLLQATDDTDKIKSDVYLCKKRKAEIVNKETKKKK